MAMVLRVVVALVATMVTVAAQAAVSAAVAAAAAAAAAAVGRDRMGLVQAAAVVVVAAAAEARVSTFPSKGHTLWRAPLSLVMQRLTRLSLTNLVDHTLARRTKHDSGVRIRPRWEC